MVWGSTFNALDSNITLGKDREELVKIKRGYSVANWFLSS